MHLQLIDDLFVKGWHNAEWNVLFIYGGLVYWPVPKCMTNLGLHTVSLFLLLLFFFLEEIPVFVFSYDYRDIDALWLFYKYCFLEIIFLLNIFTFFTDLKILDEYTGILSNIWEKDSGINFLSKCHRN